MQITRVEAVTFRKGVKVGGGPGGNEDAEWFWVRLHADSGLVGRTRSQVRGYNTTTKY